MVSNSQLVCLYSFIMMKVMENESLLLAKIMENSAVLDENNVDEFYDKQTAYLETWIEKFTNTASGLEIDHCIKLYLNIAKYEPLKGSSKIPLPEALANKKAIINLPNEDDRCLEWALLSILYYNENNPSKLSSYRKYLDTLHLKGIDIPTPLSQIPKVEKQNPDFAINVYGNSVSPKKQKIRIFPYYISDRPQKNPPSQFTYDIRRRRG